MDNQLKNTNIRGEALYRYITALEEGNFDALVVLFHQAEQDEMLARMIEEVHALYQTEEDWTASQEDTQRLRPQLARLFLNEEQTLPSPSVALQPNERMNGNAALEEEGQPTEMLPSNINLGMFLNRLQEIGLKNDFVLQRLIPSSLTHRLQTSKTASEAHGIFLEVAAIIEQIFKIPPVALFSSNALSVDQATVGATRFKKDTRQQIGQISAYTVYAHHLARLVLNATAHIPPKSIPTQSEAVKEAILSSYGELSFTTTLRYIWDLGIPVLPLSDKGAFHGACWRINYRNVIVVKQQTQSDARWLFDLLHELRHAGQNPEQAQFEVVEADTVLLAEQVTNEEKVASAFAGNVILHEQAEELTQFCVRAAHGRVEALKRVVPLIAEREQVAVDALANYLAFRLSLQGINWWPTAMTLQTPTNTAWPTARELILQKIHLNILEDSEQQLLLQALQ